MEDNMTKKKQIRVDIVNVADVLRDEDRRALWSHPNEGKMNPEWGASQVWGTVRIGKINSEASGYQTNYLENTLMTVSSLRELYDLAEKSKLEVINAGEYDMDGIVQRNYRFRTKE